MKKVISMIFLLILFLFVVCTNSCDPCYNQQANQNCPQDQIGKDSYTLHMSVHPHLDAFWIFDFESYYDPKPNQGDVHGYFNSNRFTSVKNIFRITKDVLWESKNLREKVSNKTQKAHRSFFNSQIGFFKRWFQQQNPQEKQKVRDLLSTKYWQILGGGYVQHDEGCAYYDDIIQNFEMGLHYLKEELSYYPKIAISADSFGHSQSTLAILAHLGIEGFFVQRSDEHILLQNKTQFIWKALSANGRYYGALPTHIRWAIHGFQDQFVGSNLDESLCETKEFFINNLRNQNKFLKRILQSNHIMRYFGHDFQEFNDYSYSVIEGMMKKFSMEKCNKVTALYGNPTQYFISLMGQVFGKKVKPIATRSTDIFPIWDYNSGLYWTGYFTTDAYHKKDYRDLGRFLHGIRKLFITIYVNKAHSQQNANYYQLLEQLAEQVSYLQHHDGISGTSKYSVMDKLEIKNQQLYEKAKESLLQDVFTEEFPNGTNVPIFDCHLGKVCKIPEEHNKDIYLKIINADGSPLRDPVVVQLPAGKYYQPDCDYEVNCLCYEEYCPCKLYLYKPLYTFTSVRLKLSDSLSEKPNRLVNFISNEEYSFNFTHFTMKVKGSPYSIGYKRVTARGTNRVYDHLSRFGTQGPRQFNIRPGKYALGNDPNDIKDFSFIKKVSKLQSQRGIFFLVQWKRYSMKTLITILKESKNQFKVQTLSATQGYHLSDLYFQVITPIKNNEQFVTDSNGWLTVKRQLFKHEDYEAFFSKEKYDDLNGNTYPATAFAFIEDGNDKVSVNLDKPQGVVAYHPGTLWINFDRLTQDDGKWVYESAYRSEYQKYTHTITVQNKNFNQRRIQRQYDQFLFIQGNSIVLNQKIEDNQIDIQKRNEWNKVSNIDNLKFTIRPFNDSSTILRVHNLHDSETVTLGLFAGKISPLLTTYYARTVSFENVEQTSLGGNMNYGNFLNEKWNWNKVVDLRQENSIFNKIFRQNITLSPLQIRTFKFTKLKLDEKCIQVSDLRYSRSQTFYKLQLSKDQPEREPSTISIEQEIIRYNQQGSHCEDDSPVLQKTNLTTVNYKPSAPYYAFETITAIQDNPVNAKIDPIRPQLKWKSKLSQAQLSAAQLKSIVEKFKQKIINQPHQTKRQPKNADQKKNPKELQSPKVKQSKVLSIAQIEQRVKNLLPLSLAQKQYYFSNKLIQIRAKQPNPIHTK